MHLRVIALAASLTACHGLRLAQMTGPSENDLESHAAALREHLEGSGLTVVVEPPFVVVGDEPAPRVRRRAETTLRWAIQRFEADFFDRRPEKIVTIWMFHNERAYRRGAARFFGDTPTTPYGYYNAENDAVIVNIGRGSGTLVHEVIHPFIESDFPDAPVWFNEGMASLYERPTDRAGHIVGRNNWRLPSLQREIVFDRLPSIESLMAMPTKRFYYAGFDSYAYARYLMMYIQDRGLLPAFYAQFKRDAKRDPTGRSTLLAVLGIRDLAAFKRYWSRWVLDQAPV